MLSSTNAFVYDSNGLCCWSIRIFNSFPISRRIRNVYGKHWRSNIQTCTYWFWCSQRQTVHVGWKRGLLSNRFMVSLLLVENQIFVFHKVNPNGKQIKITNRYKIFVQPRIFVDFASMEYIINRVRRAQIDQETSDYCQRHKGII